jgi:hypothetical protein
MWQDALYSAMPGFPVTPPQRNIVGGRDGRLAHGAEQVAALDLVTAQSVAFGAFESEFLALGRIRLRARCTRRQDRGDQDRDDEKPG